LSDRFPEKKPPLFATKALGRKMPDCPYQRRRATTASANAPVNRAATEGSGM